MEIEFFNEDVERSILGLEISELAKTLRTLDLLEEFGEGLGMPHSKRVARNLLELRVRGKREIRIIYGFRENRAVLLCVFVKKTNKIPRRYLLLANKRLNIIDAI